MKKIVITTCLGLILMANTAKANPAVEFPKLKAGQWEITTNMPGMPQPTRAQFCIDEATQQRMFDQSRQGMTGCEAPQYKQEGKSYIVNTKCNFSGQASTTKAKITFLNETTYTNEVDIQSAHGPMNMKSQGKYVGNCPAGMKPGDMRLVGMENVPGLNGMQFNMSDFAKQMGKDVGKIPAMPSVPAGN
ncbi:DUF3617 family protein [bacterium]|nr:DUF3617 family protein [bacterium]